MSQEPDSILDDPGVKGLLLAICRALGQLIGWVKRYYEKQSA